MVTVAVWEGVGVGMVLREHSEQAVTVVMVTVAVGEGVGVGVVYVNIPSKLLQ